MNGREALESLMAYAVQRQDENLIKEIRHRMDLVIATRFDGQKAETKELDKEIHIDQVEKWIRELTECSYDRRDEVRQPTRECVNTANELFIVERRALIDGIRYVRRYHHIYRPPNNWKIPDTMSEAFNACKTLYSVILTTEFAMQNLSHHKDKILQEFRPQFEDAAAKLAKLVMFVETVNKILHDLQCQIGEVSQQEKEEYELAEAAKPIPKPTTRQHDRPTRSAKGRQNTTRKPFSLTDLLARNRNRA